MSVFQSLLNFVNRDVNGQNETKTVPVMIRIVSIGMGIYLLLMQIHLLDAKLPVLFAFDIVCIVMLAISFLLTYKSKNVPAVILQHVAVLVWIFAAILFLGWECGAQQFITLLLVTLFTGSYMEWRIKIEYSVLLVMLHVGLHLYMTINGPYYYQTFFEMLYTHILSIIFCFGIISVVVVTFAYNSISMETKLKGYNANLKRLANVDPLTGLKNRRCMMNFLKEHVESNDAIKTEKAVIVIGDIDFFKRFNDHYGHACGDEVLTQLSALFMDYMEGKGEAARWGGEEFLLVFTDCSLQQGIEYMDNLIHRIRLMDIRYGGEVLHVTMTFGMSEYDPNRTVDAIINNADKKLYFGKQNGRNRVVYTIPTDFVIDKK